MTPWLLFALGILSVPFAVNAIRPVRHHPFAAIVSFFAGWLTTDLPLHQIAWQIVAAAVIIAYGGLGSWPGWWGLGLWSLFWLVLLRSLARSLEARPILESALREEIDIEPSMGPVPLGRLALFFPKRPSCVERLRDVPYARPHRHAWSMDIYRHEDRPKNAPMIVEVHGGGWVLGDKREQGLPLMYHMAERGWLCASANYRLSPGATFPDQLIDLKRAVAHLRAHGRDYGGDPSFIIITGGSAGGHLASLVALTAGDPRYQPGFEEADTRVAGCVSAYGVYDLADSDGHWLHDGFHKLMETQVLKATRKEAPELFAEASPICRVAKDAPPFFIVHGDCDSLVPVGGARAFAAALRRESSSPVVYAELPEAQHAFDVFYCVRSLLVVQAVEEFSRHLYESGRSG